MIYVFPFVLLPSSMFYVIIGHLAQILEGEDMWSTTDPNP